jgi:hypothetical protein
VPADALATGLSPGAADPFIHLLFTELRRPQPPLSGISSNHS